MLDRRIVFKRKIDKNGGIDRNECRLLVQGLRQMKGIHYEKSSSPTPAQASIRMVLGIIAILG